MRPLLWAMNEHRIGAGRHAGRTFRELLTQEPHGEVALRALAHHSTDAATRAAARLLVDALSAIDDVPAAPAARLDGELEARAIGEARAGRSTP